MAMGSHLSIITLNVNGLTAQPKDKDWLNGYKTRPQYMLSTRDPPQNKRHIQTENKSWKIYSTQIENKRKQE